MVESNSNPPLLHDYRELVQRQKKSSQILCSGDQGIMINMEEEYYNCDCDQVPLIDLSGLRSEEEGVRDACGASICKASSEWGFFQVVNHGISLQLLREMRREQVELFKAPFERKKKATLLINNNNNNNPYRWGNPTATSPNQFSWSEAFHIPLANDISDHQASCALFSSTLRKLAKEYAGAMQELARLIAGVLAMNLSHQKGLVLEGSCNQSTCFIRMNRYPPCPLSPVFGFVPHTDSDFLTILHQDDEVGGLHLLKDSKWVAVKPNQDALIVNIGDLFQAWSNDVYKSVEHKVVADAKAERYSIAYFLCPSYDSLIGSCKEPSIYRKFTFAEYREQVQQDVKMYGHKVGLRRFLNLN